MSVALIGDHHYHDDSEHSKHMEEEIKTKNNDTEYNDNETDSKYNKDNDETSKFT